MNEKNSPDSSMHGRGVHFRFASTEAEFQEVLALRFAEYSAVGKVAKGKTKADMTDEFDRRAKIVIGVHKNEIVASIRMIFHDATDRLEQEQFVVWPPNAPARAELVEATRACVRRDFRGTELFLAMLTFFGREAMKFGKRNIVLCATKEMVPFYRKLGARTVGLPYAHTFLNGTLHYVMNIEIRRALFGAGVNPVLWNLTWGRVYVEPRVRLTIRGSAFDRLRARAFLLLKTFAEMQLEKKLQRKSVRMRVDAAALAPT